METPDWSIEKTVRSIKDVLGLGKIALLELLDRCDPAEVTFPCIEEDFGDD